MAEPIPQARPTSPRPSVRRAKPNGSPEWDIEQSADLYQIRGWGEPYFSINEKGHVEVRPDPDVDRAIDLYDLAQDLQARGIELPILVRFSEILAHRIRSINEAFGQAIEEYEYKGVYRGVYPVKVNQQRHIVEEIVEFGKQWSFGLEVGSKPELLIALAMMRDSSGLVICNGYKDLTYIETALIAQRFDRTVIVVLERIEEFDLVLKASERLQIRPILGVRAKLASKGMGRWKESAGDHAKFGLTTAQIVELVDRLSDRNMLDCLKLLHFHIGSQISSIIPVKNAIQEAANIYVELAKMGCAMGYLDVGGGLAIDYDGSKTDFHASRNYTMHEYAADVVSTIQNACAKRDVPDPTIVSESGRAVVAHQSVLVFDVVGANEIYFGQPVEPKPDANRVLKELYDTYKGIRPKNVQESFHDASQMKEEAQSLFKYGYLTLRERAQAERLYWNCCEKIRDTVRRLKFVPEELQDIERAMGTIYYCNFSVFQSAPDSWAIDQLFPIMPIQRLNESPTVRATLADLTCDSDGVIDHFIDVEETKSTLDVHAYKQGDSYYLGMFLNGAYQEILGDLHNLFGDTNAVHVRLNESSYKVTHVIRGDSMSEVLRSVAHTPEGMTESVREQAEAALGAGKITLEQMRLLLRHYEQALGSYTYLTGDD
ncbi:MAG TPA: biosynthetic arginine decarboxylase [Polyangiaceae bacterium]|jgi:arginine decarboxylase|nr:biosynthetic arginine decarboxylase [Polyangiaceae bacterium]